MHEAHLARGIIDTVVAKATAEGYSSVIAIRLEAGELSGIAPASLRTSFEESAKGTLLEGAELHIDIVPLTAICNSCSAAFAVNGAGRTCTTCGSPDYVLTGGNELRVTELHVET